MNNHFYYIDNIYMLILLVFLILLLLFLILKKSNINGSNTQNIKSFFSNNNEPTKYKSRNKVLKYFGAHFCPYSNKNSKAYKFINSTFRKKYPNVKIEINWGDNEEANRANIEYYPTIANKNYRNIDLHIPRDTNSERIIMQEIYNQL